MNTAATNHIGSSLIPLVCTKDISFNGGELVPVHSFPVVPGDVVNLKMEEVMRQISANLNPVFDDLHVDIRCFYVPDRLVFPRISEMFGENKTGVFDVTSSLKPITPRHAISGGNTITDTRRLGHYYYGVAHPTATLPLLSSKKTRGYCLIWNEWYRDQNTQPPLLLTFDDANDTNDSRAYALNAPLLSVNRPHDYFTSLLPKPQKGEASLANLSGMAPVITGAVHTPFATGNISDSLQWANESGIPSSSFPQTIGVVNFPGANPSNQFITNTYPSPQPSGFGGRVVPSNLWANMENIGSITVNDMRLQFAHQRILEKNARFGTRWREYLMAHHGVFFDEYLVQIPKYLGGDHYLLNQYQVPNTSDELGELASYTYKSCSKRRICNYSIIEFGRIHVLMCVRKRTTYQQALDRDDFETDESTYYNPEYAHVGEQAVLAPELFGYTSFRDRIIGYGEPWLHLRQWHNRAVGDFNTASTRSLDTRHYGDFFTLTPTLNGLVVDNTREMVDRTLKHSSAVSDQFGFNFRFTGTIQRNMPLYSIPGNLDHGYTGRF